MSSLAILLSVFNNEDTIEKCLLSIKKQTLKNWRAYVVDDCSFDNTYKIIKKVCSNDERFIIIKNKTNIGLTKNLVKLIDMSSSDFIARIDADDYYYYPKKLEKQLDFFKKNKDYILCGTGFTMEKQGVICGHSSYKEIDITNDIFKWNKISHGTVLFRRIPGLNYRSYFKYSQDYDLWLRMSCFGKIGVLPQKFYRLNINKNSISSKFTKKQAKFGLIALSNSRKLINPKDNNKINSILGRVLFMSLKTFNFKYFWKILKLVI